MKTTGKTDGRCVAVLSDIHANLPALSAVLEDVASCLGTNASLLILGDVVSLGTSPHECVRLLRGEQDARFVSGNNERYIIEKLYDSAEEFHCDFFEKVPEGIRDNLRWTRENLLNADIEFLSNWPHLLDMKMNGVRVLATHASRRSDEDVILGRIGDKNSSQDWHRYDVYLFGHTHKAFMEATSGTLFLNPGSVGFPLDGDTRASYAILDLAKDPIEAKIRRIEYDVGETLSQVTTAAIPFADEITAVLRRASMQEGNGVTS